METKPLLYGLIGFIIGGLIVSVAASTREPRDTATMPNMTSTGSSSMQGMASMLKNKTGDAFDEAFIAGMIVHHEGAVDMAKLSAANAKHDEIKQLSEDIITAQEKEIAQMKQWQSDWGYDINPTSSHSMHEDY